MLNYCLGRAIVHCRKRKSSELYPMTETLSLIRRTLIEEKSIKNECATASYSNEI